MKTLDPNKWQLTMAILIALLTFIGFTIWLISFGQSFADPSCSNEDRRIVSSAIPISILWTISIDGCFQYSPVSQNNRVIGRTGTALLIFESINGKEILNLPAGRMGRNPNFASHGDILVFSSNAGKVVNALNIQTLRLLWSHSPGGIAETGALSTAIDGYGVYLADGVPGQFYAFEPTTGNLLWKNPKVGTTFGDILTVQDDLVNVLVTESLYKLERKTGNPVETIQNKFTGGKTVVADGTVYQFHTNSLTAQKIENGEIEWQFDKPAFSLAALPERMIVASQGNRQRGLNPSLYSLDRHTGIVQWQRNLDASPVSDPVAIGEVGYLMLDDASIHAFNIGTGNTVGRLETNPPRIGNKFDLAGLTTDGESLFVTFGDSFLFKFGR